MGGVGSKEPVSAEAVRVQNPDGRSPYLFVCDHASNFVPDAFGTFGLPPGDIDRHIAWDPGALPVASALADALDATLIHSGISRLVIDCNRPLDAGNLFWTVSEGTVIPGNQNLSEDQRRARIALAYTPFHEMIRATVEKRLAAGQETRIVSIHSFTPVYSGVSRPWEIGIIHDEDDRLAVPMIAALEADKSLTVGVNEPYSPADKVYFTLEKHARSRSLACAMIEIRNSEIADAAGQLAWAARLAKILGSQAMTAATRRPLNEGGAVAARATG